MVIDKAQVLLVDTEQTWFLGQLKGFLIFYLAVNYSIGIFKIRNANVLFGHIVGHPLLTHELQGI